MQKRVELWCVSQIPVKGSDGLCRGRGRGVLKEGKGKEREGMLLGGRGVLKEDWHFELR